MSDAKIPVTDFGRTFCPRLITRKPMRGKTGISQCEEYHVYKAKNFPRVLIFCWSIEKNEPRLEQQGLARLLFETGSWISGF